MKRMCRRALDRRALAGIVVALALATAFLPSSLPGGAGVVAAQDSPDTTVARSPRTTSAPSLPSRPGRIAYVTLAGEVFVASSDGSNARMVGQGAVANRAGLAPLAWSTDDTKIAYVRRDRKLAIVKIDSGEVTEVDDNVVVPPEADQQIISFDITDRLVIYVSEVSPGRFAAKSANFSETPPVLRQISDPATRSIISLRFSPIDPVILAQTADVETGKQFTAALIDPLLGTIVSGPVSLDDPVITPDGAAAYGVLRNTGGIDQLFRVDISTFGLFPITEHEKICGPTPNHDGTKVVFGAGAGCTEVWVIDGDGRNERRIEGDFGGNSFLSGSFSWSLDDTVVSHPACKALAETVLCGGPYWDIRVDGGGGRQRAQAGSVQRETRPFLRPVKVQVEMTGPIEYKKKIIASAGKSDGNLLTQPGAELVTGKVVDESDDTRSFGMQGYHPTSEPYLTGTMHFQDGKDFDRTVMFMGQITLSSFRYLALHAIWLDTSAFPIQSGRLDIIIYR